MKYLLTLYNDESARAYLSPERQAEGMKAWDAYTKDAMAAGVYLGGEGLEPTATATTIRIEESGDTVVSDGPFAETKEQLGGYYLLDCEDLDDALAWAKRIPMPGGAVEVRAVMDYDKVGSEMHSNRPGAEARG